MNCDHEAIRSNPNDRTLSTFNGIQRDADGRPLYAVHTCATCFTTVAVLVPGSPLADE